MEGTYIEGVANHDGPGSCVGACEGPRPLQHLPPGVPREKDLPFKQWRTVFPGAACISALIDRFVQHCHILDIDADSWRQKESLAMSETAPRRRRRSPTRPPRSWQRSADPDDGQIPAALRVRFSAGAAVTFRGHSSATPKVKLRRILEATYTAATPRRR